MIHWAPLQSAGASGPVSQRPAALHGEATPSSSRTRTRHQYSVSGASARPAYRTAVERADVTLPVSHRSASPAASRPAVEATSIS